MGHLVGVSVEEQLGEASEESFVGPSLNLL